MKCKRVRKKLSAYVDKELKGDTRLKIKQHLAGCPPCRQEAKLLAQAWKTLELWGRVEVPDSFEARFWQKIREREKKRISLPGLMRRIVKVPVPAAAVIILATGLILGNYLGNILYPKGEKLSTGKLITLAKNDILYLETFDDLPPESVGNVYFSLVSQKEIIINGGSNE